MGRKKTEKSEEVHEEKKSKKNRKEKSIDKNLLFIFIIILIGIISMSILFLSRSNIFKKEIVQKDGNDTISMNIGDGINLSDYVEDIRMIKSYAVDRDQIVSIDEQYNITALQEGDVKVIVKYNNNKTEEFDIQSRVKSSKAAINGSIIKITLNKSGGDGGLSKIYFKYGGGFYMDSSCSQMFMGSSDYDGWELTSIPKRSGYAFGGYYTSSNGQGKQIINEKGKIVRSNVTRTMYSSDSTLYAKWVQNTTTTTPTVFSIKLDKQGGTSGSNYVYEKYKYNIYKDPGCTVLMSYYSNPIDKPTKDGYKFEGYYTGTSGTGTKLIDENGKITGDFTSTKFTANSTIYASWTATSKIYTITLYKNGGTGGDNVIYESYNTAICKDTNCQTIMYTSSNPIAIPTKTGYTFGGYYTGANGTGTQLITSKGYKTSNFKTTLYNSNTKIYAKWIAEETKVYTVTLNEQGGSGGITTLYIKYGSGIYTEKECRLGGEMISHNVGITTPKRTNYTFKGYFTATGGKGTKIIDEKGSITSNFNSKNYTSNITLYAYWESTYSETKNKEVCYINGNTKIKYYITKCQPNSISGAKCEYSKKNGQPTSGTLTKAYTKDLKYCNTTTTNNQNTTKKETQKTYTITLDSQGATIKGTTTIYEVYNNGIYLKSDKTDKMTTTTSKITIPKKTGYTFKGFYTSKNNGNILITSNGYITPNFTPTRYTNNTIIYARWEANYSEKVLQNLCYNDHIYHITYCQKENSTKTANCKYDKIDETVSSGIIRKSKLQLESNCTKKAKIYEITLNRQGGTSGTTTIYEKYGEGIYKDSNCTQNITGNNNAIATPKKTNYTFKGYYQYSNGEGKQLINEKGYIKSSFINTLFNKNNSIYAYWMANYSQKVNTNKCYVKGNSKILYHITYCQVQDKEKTARCKYDKKSGVESDGTISRRYLQDYSKCNAKTESKPKTETVYTIKLDNENANVTGTTMIYEKYGEGIYLNENAKKKMTTSSRAITTPIKKGYHFRGYYTSKNGQGKKLIGENGKITSEFTEKLFKSNATIYAHWENTNKEFFANIQQLSKITSSYIKYNPENKIIGRANSVYRAELIFPLQYIRRNKYGFKGDNWKEMKALGMSFKEYGEKYPNKYVSESNNWSYTAGDIDRDFYDYVHEHNRSLESYKFETIIDPVTGYEIDFVHMSATLNAIINQYGFDHHEVVAELGGWTGDLATIVKQVVQKDNYDKTKGKPKNYDELLKYAKELIGKTTNEPPGSTLDVHDMLANIDASNIYHTYIEEKSSEDYDLYTALTTYYNNLKGKQANYRYQEFKKSTLKNDAIKRVNYYLVTERSLSEMIIINHKDDEIENKISKSYNSKYYNKYKNCSHCYKNNYYVDIVAKAFDDYINSKIN